MDFTATPTPAPAPQAPGATPAPTGQPAPSPAPAPAAPSGAPGVPGMPQGGHAKFYNPQTGAYNWQAHAIEQQFQLDQMRNRGGGQPAPQAPNGMPNGAPSGSSPTDTNSLVENLTRAVASGGDALEERMALLQAGVPKAMVESYVQAVQVSQHARVQEAVSYAGGPEQVQQLRTWAAQNLNAQERAALNAQMNGPNWKMAIDYVRARMGNVPNGTPNVDLAAPNGAGAGVAFRNQAELASAIAKRNEQGQRLYDVDENYRRQVMERARASNF